MRLFDSGVGQLREAFSGLASDVDYLREEQQDLREAANGGLAALRAEDIGWRLISGGVDSDEIDIDLLRNHAQEARALRAFNPLVKRGVVVRNAYIWQHDIIYPNGANKIIDDPVNQKGFFSQEAREELEAAYCTDGQYFVTVDPRKKQIRRVPFSEITGVVVNPEYKSEVWFYRRTYTRTVTDASGATKQDKMDVYHPSITYTGDRRRKTIGDVRVDYSKVIEHSKVNSATGFRYGIPDLLGAVYWARAYKEYLEASYTLAKALARLAFKVSNSSNRGSKGVAAKLAQPVPRSEAGSTVSLGAGQDLTAINKSGSGIDFGAGSPLAAMVAAALDIPLSVVLTDGSAGGRQGAEAALEDPTIKTMNLRRQTHLASRNRILAYLGVRGKATWQVLDGSLQHRAMQSLQLGADLGTLHPEEIRKATIEILHIVTDKAIDDIPEDYKREPTNATNVSGPGPLSDGTNDSRDNPGGPTDA